MGAQGAIEPGRAELSGAGQEPVVAQSGDTGPRAQISVAAERTTKIQIVPARRVSLLELGPTTFRAGSAVPRLQTGRPPRLVDALLVALAHLRDHPDEPCLVAGHHADAGLAEARAAAVRALLRGDADALGAACQARHTVEDWQELCQLAAREHGWACDPGAVDGKPGPKSRKALDELRRRRGLPAGDASAPPAAAAGDWGALLGITEGELARRLGLADTAALGALRGRVAWAGPGAVGCAAHWPPGRTRLREYTPEHTERVDVLAFEPEHPPKLACHAAAACDPNQCDLYRKGKYRAVRLEPTGRRAIRLELASTYFNTASAQFLPRLDDPHEHHEEDQGSAEERGLEAIVYTLRYLELYPDRALVVAGHTDTAGADAYNRPLSEARAQCVVALIEGDRDGFVAACKRYHVDEDDAYVLRYAARTRGWTCDPGDAPRATKAQVEAFQVRYNQTFAKSIAEDGVAGPQTWGAYFDLYEDDLRGLAGGADALAAQRARVRWVDAGKKALGCGEDFPRVGVGVDGQAEQENRRTEVLFFEPAELPPVVSGPAIYGGDYGFDPLDLCGADYRADLRIVDALERPLAGATVGIHHDADGKQIGETRQTDGEGLVLWERLPFGRYTVHVEHEGFAFSAPIVLRGEDGKGGPLDVVAPPRYRAHLRLLDAAERPLGGAEARMFRADDGAPEGEAKPADDQGLVRFDDLPVEEYVVHVTHDGRAFSRFVDLREGDGEPLDVVAPPRFRAHLRVLDVDERPVRGATVRLARADDGVAEGASKKTDAKGEVRFDDLPIDEYVAEVERAGLRFSAPIVLRASDTDPLLVLAPPRHRVAIQCVRADESPVPGAVARLYEETGAPQGGPRTTDASGQAAWDDVPPGEYVVWLQVDGAAFSSPLPLVTSTRATASVVLVPEVSAP